MGGSFSLLHQLGASEGVAATPLDSMDAESLAVLLPPVTMNPIMSVISGSHGHGWR